MNKLETIFFKKAKELQPRQALFDTTINQLNKMKQHSLPTYYHELRVALIASKIAEYCDYKDIRPEFFGGANHDTGKLTVKKVYLETANITEAEFKKIKKHTKEGLLALKGHIFTSLIAGAHHHFQENSYGVNPKKAIREVKMADDVKDRLNDAIINVSLADYYDACNKRGTKIMGKDNNPMPEIERDYPQYLDRIKFLKSDPFVKEIIDIKFDSKKKI